MAHYITVLLATFTNNDYVDSVVRRVYKCFQLENDRIFVFSDVDNEFKKILTYNVLIPQNDRVDVNKVNNTIRINRKKESNTLYTINSLNMAIKAKTGKIDPGYNLDWSEFRNCLMIADKETDEISLIHTEIYTTIDRNTFFTNGTIHPQTKQQPRRGNNPQYI